MDLSQKNKLTRELEAILFACNGSITLKMIVEALEVGQDVATEVIADYARYLDREERGFILREVAGGYRLHSNPAYTSAVQKALEDNEPPKLSQAALETLAIVAYLQPVTRAQIASIRGVNVESVLSTLFQRELISEAGREDSPGQPILYKTTSEFLRVFGLRGLNELPKLEEFAASDEEVDNIRKRLGLYASLTTGE